MSKRNLEWEGFSSSSQRGPKPKGHDGGEVLLTGLFPVASSACLLIVPRTISSVGGTAHSEMGPPTSRINQIYQRLAHRSNTYIHT